MEYSAWDIRFAVHEVAKASARKKRAAAGKEEWLKDRHAVRMGLWDGKNLDDSLTLQWSCKRLTADMALRQDANDPAEPVAVTRADRLGRAAVDAKADSSIGILGFFNEDHWNGRLQAPRAQLDAIAQHVTKHGWDAKARQMRNRIRWLVSFSAKLQAAGPWIEYATRFADNDVARPFVSRRGEYAVKHQTNDEREGHAKLILSRLPGLRVLSVDLGHRFAAACAVWRTVTAKEMNAACKAANHAPPAESDLFLHLPITDADGKKRTTIYRRIGADQIEDIDDDTGEVRHVPHCAPWARLERQFLIKLPGEDRPARAASNKGSANEVQWVADFARGLGLVTEDDRAKGRAVDELMSRAVRTASLALKRHARRAKITYAFDPSTKAIPGMGGSEKQFQAGDADHIQFLVGALFDWHSLASESQWADGAARELWNLHIAPLGKSWRIEEPKADAQAAEDRTRQQRRKNDDTVRERLKPVAEQLVGIDRTEMHKAWKERWESDDGAERDKVDFKHHVTRDDKGRNHSTTAAIRGTSGWHTHLRGLTDWIMGLHMPGSDGDGWKWNVGGLSITRIATMKSLYQLHKAFAMRARPDKPRGAPEKGETNAGVAQSILNAMERMREQRVKQLASRIAEAALGIGRMKPTKGDHDRKRLRERVDEPCHAVVIENLTNYRPEEIRTHRENRQLMAWSAAKVRKYLSEACQLHGLHLRQVQAGYTSRQDSRTGAPGVRCADVPLACFLTATWWRRQVNTAKEKVRQGKGDARDAYLVDLDAKCCATDESARKAAPSLRIPVPGGELFISADPRSPAAKGLQADLNAAANIGLKALLDPDWPGRWWYIPCTTKDGKPSRDKVKGAACVDLDEPLYNPPKEPSERSGGKAKKKEIINVWRDPSALLMKVSWEPTAAYWRTVRSRVIDVLRSANGLTASTAKIVEPTEVPW